MITTQNVLYTGKTHTTGGREGASRSDDGRLELKLSKPETGHPGTNPEQLLAAGWSACYLSAVQATAKARKVPLRESAVDAEIDLRKGEGGYSLAARFLVSLPGLDRELAQSIAEAAHETCPYTKAVHGNVEVTTDVTV